jgi:stearoyl-CoA desaturase (delta-9 desaturase)
MGSAMGMELSSAGILTGRKEIIANYVLNALSIFVPFFGFLAGMFFFPAFAPTTITISIFLVFFLLNIIGVIMGLHRYFTHRSFETSSLFRVLLGIWGSWAMQGPIDRWVADHRRHHRYSDQPLDVHSPYWKNQEKISSGFMRFAHAHFLWMFVGLPTDIRQYAKDTISDPISRGCSQWYWFLCATSLLLPALVGYGISGSDEALRSFFWAGCFRVFLLHQFTWSVNSFGHMFGGKAEKSRDEARDNMVLTFLVFGEGLHSYHHVHQSTAVNQPVYLDLAGQFINLLEKLHVVWNVKRY